MEEATIAKKVFVGNLSFDTQKRELEALFSQAGEVVDCFLPSDRATGRPRGFAFVEFADEAGMTAAIARFDGYELGGRTLRVNEAQAQRPRPGGGFSSGGPSSGGGYASGFGSQEPPSFIDAPPLPRGKSKGSRRNLRAKKRSLY